MQAFLGRSSAHISGDLPRCLSDASPLHQLHGAAAPMLLIHSEHDTVVPTSQAEAMTAAAAVVTPQQAGGNGNSTAGIVTLRIVEGCHHLRLDVQKTTEAEEEEEEHTAAGVDKFPQEEEAMAFLRRALR